MTLPGKMDDEIPRAKESILSSLFVHRCTCNFVVKQILLFSLLFSNLHCSHQLSLV
jgi:hypothetical protein